MDIKTLKSDLVANSKTYDNYVAKRNTLNIEIFRMEGVILYIKALIRAEELKLANEKKEKEEKEKEGGEKKSGKDS